MYCQDLVEVFTAAQPRSAPFSVPLSCSHETLASYLVTTGILSSIHLISLSMCLVSPSVPQCTNRRLFSPQALELISRLTVGCLLEAFASPSCWHSSCFEMRLRPVIYRRSFSLTGHLSIPSPRMVTIGIFVASTYSGQSPSHVPF